MATANQIVFSPLDGAYTPSRCGAHGRALEFVLNELAALGVRVPRVGRLRQAAALLVGVGDAGAYPSDPDLRARIAHAMIDSADWVDIGTMLEGHPAVLRTLIDTGDVGRAMKGTIADSRLRQTPYRLQTQLWWGAVLARAGITPELPPSGSAGLRSPDYLVGDGTMRYGLEVKRAESGASAEGLLRDAADQLRRYGVFGGVALDLTECLPLPERLIYPDADRAAVEARLVTDFHALYYRLLDTVQRAHDLGSKAGFERVRAVVATARGAYFTVADDGQVGLVLDALTAAYYVGPLAATVTYHHMMRLLDRLTDGLREVGFAIPAFRDVARPRNATPPG